MKKTIEEADWGSAAISGVLGGTAMLILDLALAVVAGESMWMPLRRIAAILVGPGVLADGNEGFVLFFGLALHFTLSITFAFLFEPVMRKLEPGPAILTLASLGCALYALDYHALSFFFPWFAAARGGAAMAAHMTYGAVMGTVYARLHRSTKTFSHDETRERA